MPEITLLPGSSIRIGEVVVHAAAPVTSTLTVTVDADEARAAIGRAIAEADNEGLLQRLGRTSEPTLADVMARLDRIADSLEAAHAHGLPVVVRT